MAELTIPDPLSAPNVTITTEPIRDIDTLHTKERRHASQAAEHRETTAADQQAFMAEDLDVIVEKLEGIRSSRSSSRGGKEEDKEAPPPGADPIAANFHYIGPAGGTDAPEFDGAQSKSSPPHKHSETYI